jgi:antitoxin HicB
MLQAYPVRLVRDQDGSYVAEVPDVPGTLTVGSSRQEALEWIQDALVVALSGYVEARKDIPPPSRPRRGQPVVALPPLVAIKLVLYQAMRDQGLSQAELARRLGCDPRQVRRLLDLDHNSRLDLLERALKAVGKRLVVDIRDAA